MKRYPFAGLLFALALGITVREEIFYSLSFDFLFYSGLSVWIVLLVVWKIPWLFEWLLMLCVFILGVLLHLPSQQFPENQKINFKPDELFLLHFRIESIEKSNEFFRKYSVLTSYGKRVLIKCPLEVPLLSLTKTYFATGFVREIEPPKNPNTFHYQKFLRRKGIYYEFKLDTILSEHPRKLNFFENLQAYRENWRQKIEQSTYSLQAKSLIKALILGDRTGMDEDMLQNLSKAGIMHLLAISGLHIGLLYVFVLWFFRLITFGRAPKPILMGLAVTVVWLFGIFVGLKPSVLRACVMITLYVLAWVLHRPQPLNHVLSLTAFFALIFNTQQLYEVGFQLSYAAVFFIGWLNPMLQRRVPLKIFFNQRWLRDIFTVTLSAQIGTLPISSYYFHQFSLLAPLVNLVIIPFAALILVASLISSIFILVSFEWNFFQILYEWLTKYILFISEWAAKQDIFLVEDFSLHLLEVLVLLMLAIFLRKLLTVNNLQSWNKFLGGILMFLLLRELLTLQAQKNNEFVVFHTYGKSLCALAMDKKIIFFGEAVDDKTKNFVLKPFMYKRRTKTIKFYPLLEDYSLDGIKVLVVYDGMNDDAISDANILWFSHSPRSFFSFDKTKLKKQKIWVIDGSNSKSFSEKILAYASNFPSIKVWKTHEKGALQISF